MKKSKFHDLDFSDVTPHDLNLINSIATYKMNDSDRRASEVIVETVFEFINARGMKIVRDETREDTWSTPKKSWYAKYQKPKNWW